MKTPALLLLMACAAVSGFPSHAAEAIRTTAEGVVRGEVQVDGSATFRRIPFAKAPVGELRWKPPQPIAKWSGQLDVRDPAIPCPQLDEGWNAGEAARGGEDCLTLAVREPKHAKDERLPVFVWIHGGSNRSGSGGRTVDSPIYKRGVVLVSIEYRLGVFGFLASPELSAESSHHTSGNYALLDQIAALQWVRKNIANFGGDPTNVTLGGQSAGAIDIAQLLRSPMAHSLFQKAILESGVLGPPRSAADNEAIGTALFEDFKLAKGATGLSELRRLPVAQLLEASIRLKPPSGANYNLLWIEASADGWVLPVGANTVDRRANQLGIPLIVGNNTSEFIFHGSLADARQMIGGLFGKNGPRALQLYGLDSGDVTTDGTKSDELGTRVLTDVLFRCPSIRLANWTLADGKKAWRYEFGIPRPGSQIVEHNAELDFVFGDEAALKLTLARPPIQKYWVNFMRSGDPNGSDVPPWPDLGSKRQYVAMLPNETRIGDDTGVRDSVCQLLDSGR